MKNLNTDLTAPTIQFSAATLDWWKSVERIFGEEQRPLLRWLDTVERVFGEAAAPTTPPTR